MHTHKKYHEEETVWGSGTLIFFTVWHKFSYEVFLNVQSIRPLDCHTYYFDGRLSFARENLLLTKTFYVNRSRKKLLYFPQDINIDAGKKVCNILVSLAKFQDFHRNRLVKPFTLSNLGGKRHFSLPINNYIQQKQSSGDCSLFNVYSSNSVLIADRFTFTS